MAPSTLDAVAAIEMNREGVWKALVHKTMYLVARTFDFQTFNLGSGSVWVPATASVAADHLCQLIISDGLPREVENSEDLGTDEARTQQAAFAMAAWRLHATIFNPYSKWARHVRQADFPQADEELRSGLVTDFKMIRLALLDICLYFAIWTEAANVKHMPEGMWYIFWVLRHSTDFATLVENTQKGTDDRTDAWILNPWNTRGEEQHIQTIAPRRLLLRNLFAKLILERRASAVNNLQRDKLSECIRPNGYHHSERNTFVLPVVLVENRTSEFINGLLDNVHNHIMTEIDGEGEDKAAMRKMVLDDRGVINPVDLELLLDLLVYGDGGEFSIRIITPIFQFLAFEIGHKGGTGKEPVLRITYDDANESFVLCDQFTKIVAALGVKTPKRRDSADKTNGAKESEHTIKQAFDALWKIGGATPGEWSEENAANWYRDHVFTKTYNERRTWFAFYRANFRVITFHILLFHIMLVVAILEEEGSKVDWVPGLTSVIITHSFLEAAYAYGGAYIQWKVAMPPAADKNAPYRVVSRPWLGWLCCLLPAFYTTKRNPTDFEAARDKKVENGIEWQTKTAIAWGKFKTLGMTLVWTVIFALTTFIFVLMVAAPDDWESPIKPSGGGEPEKLSEFVKMIWKYIGPGYPIVMVAHFFLTMRDGFVIGKHSVDDAVAKGWTSFLVKCCGGFSWGKNLFTSNESFLYSPPKTGWSQFIINVIFWFFVLAAKVAFDYLFVIKNLAGPINDLLRIGYLGVENGTIGGSKIPYPDADFILVVAVCLPALLIITVDTGVFYQVGVFIYGCGNGLLRLNLGLVTDWGDVIKEFHSGVKHFHSKVLSKDGQNAWTNGQSINAYYKKQLVGDTTGTTVIAMDGNQAQQGPAIDKSAIRDTAEFTTFADCWDQIIDEMRENDLISNAELADLQFKKLTVLKNYAIRPLVLPSIFYAGKVQAILDRATVPQRGNAALLQEIYFLFVVLMKELKIIPMATSIQHIKSMYLLPTTSTKYHIKIRASFIASIKLIITILSDFISKGKQLKKNQAYKDGDTKEVLAVHKGRDKNIKKITDAVVSITNFAEIELSILKARSAESDQVIVKLNAVKEIRKNISQMGEKYNNPIRMTLVQLHDGGLPQMERIVDLLKKAITQTEQQAQPKNPEARRMLRFFMATLFNPQLEAPSPLKYVMSLTTLVPHYAEDVIYALDADAVKAAVNVRPKAGEMTDLVAPTGYSITTAEYLRVLNGIEWANFVERMVKKRADSYNPKYPPLKADPKFVTEEDFREMNNRGEFKDFAQDLMLWASQRGQLLARTTRGMLLYEKALEIMASLEEPDIDLTFHPVASKQRQALLESKFRHIVASQVYGAKKASTKAGDLWLAHSTEQLMKIYPTFRIAYIDSQTLPTNGLLQYSVLLRNVHDPDAKTDTVTEIYRVKLPRQAITTHGVVLGEGKPENQNHAAIFCFGEAIQTVDMNQDNCLAEALKMRNLLHEFGTDGKQAFPKQGKDTWKPSGANVISFYKKVKAQISQRTTALVGFREYIFSNTAGSVGAFAAGSEFAFGTIVQRTMSNPGGVRFHYGHPDVWNKLFTMTRGGVSKATKAFHISEDVFGGYNTVQRGATIKYREYISVGKGRDVGFEQINGFEAKVAGGNGEQAISRDVYRLGSRFDWFRLMSWYHSGIGFFMNTALLMSSIYVSVWVLFVFALVTDGALAIPKLDGNGQIIRSTINNAIPVFNSVQIFQIGFLSILPYFGELCLEEGLVKGVFSIGRQMLAGSILFFIFRQQTSAYFFVQDVYYGGAAYVATGRGFALTHTSFVSMFSNFGRSHMYFGFQLGLMAFVLAFLNIKQYAFSTWGTWLVSVSLFFSPFWFNPLSFTTTQVYSDYLGWRAWMKDNQDPATKKSWYVWHTGQMAKARNVSGLQTDHGWNRFWGVVMQLFNIVIVMACFENIDDKQVATDSKSGTSRATKILGIVIFEAVVLLLPVWSFIKNLFQDSVNKTIDRVLSVLFTATFCGILGAYLIYFGNGAFDGLKDIVLLTFANYCIFVIIVQCLLYILPGQQWAQNCVDDGYYAADLFLGFVMFAFLFLLSVLSLFDNIQATLLFNFEFVKESAESATRALVKRILDFHLDKPTDTPGTSSPDATKKKT